MKIGNAPHPASTLSVISRGVKRTVQIHPCQQLALNLAIGKLVSNKSGATAQRVSRPSLEKPLLKILNTINSLGQSMKKQFKGARFASSTSDYVSYGSPKGVQVIVQKLPNR